jgi:hypothetical protein
MAPSTEGSSSIEDGEVPAIAACYHLVCPHGNYRIRPPSTMIDPVIMRRRTFRTPQFLTQ